MFFVVRSTSAMKHTNQHADQEFPLIIVHQTLSQLKVELVFG